MPKPLTTSEFVLKARAKHGNRYDYSLVIYKNNVTPITIRCSTHGTFCQKPIHHLAGFGCSKCSRKYPPTVDEFISNANRIHGNKYDYSRVKYINSDTPIEIVCHKHGPFFQRTNGHLSGKGCPLCYGTHLLSNAEFIEKARHIHGDEYDYSHVNYTSSHDNVTIVCKKHGSFQQRSCSHLNGRGCPKCYSKSSHKEREFLDSIGVHRDGRLVRIGKFLVDGFDIKSKIIYEFLGDYWHGNPRKYKLTEINAVTKTSYEILYNSTMEKFRKLTQLGYTVKYIWEMDWDEYKASPSNHGISVKTFNPNNSVI